MNISFDYFVEAFLDKIMEYDLVDMPRPERTAIVDGYLRRAVSEFRHICKIQMTHVTGKGGREFVLEEDVSDDDMYEIIDIISEGMIVQWLKPYYYHQENLLGVLNTRDFTTYSRAELIMRIGNTHNDARKNFVRMMRDYSYDHNNLKELWL